MRVGEEILNNKNVLMKQEWETNISNSWRKIVTENLEERKFEKVRERKRENWESKFVLTNWYLLHNYKWASCSVFIVTQGDHNYLINLPHYADLNPEN